MHNVISWKDKLPDGVRREVRVHVTRQTLKWQFKRSDAEVWDYDSAPLAQDWDQLLDILRRRVGRGKAPDVLVAVQQKRAKAGV